MFSSGWLLAFAFQFYHKTSDPFFGFLNQKRELHACVIAAWNDLSDLVGVVTLDFRQEK